MSPESFNFLEMADTLDNLSKQLRTLTKHPELQEIDETRRFMLEFFGLIALTYSEVTLALEEFENSRAQKQRK